MARRSSTVEAADSMLMLCSGGQSCRQAIFEVLYIIGQLSDWVQKILLRLVARMLAMA
jgi:hypothetical protein